MFDDGFSTHLDSIALQRESKTNLHILAVHEKTGIKPPRHSVYSRWKKHECRIDPISSTRSVPMARNKIPLYQPARRWDFSRMITRNLIAIQMKWINAPNVSVCKFGNQLFKRIIRKSYIRINDTKILCFAFFEGLIVIRSKPQRTVILDHLQLKWPFSRLNPTW